LRMRAAIIVPLSGDGARQAATWRAMYDGESRWLKQALKSASLPGTAEIETGW